MSTKLDKILTLIGVIVGGSLFIYGLAKLNVIITLCGGSIGWLAFEHFRWSKTMRRKK